MATRRRIKVAHGRAAVDAWLAAQTEPATPADPSASPQARVSDGRIGAIDRTTTATAVRFTLEELAARAPGQSLEVRVPPFGATQCIAGPVHRRGTPPAVVEMSPQVWLDLVTGRVTWARAVAAGDVDASGERSDLSEFIPIPDVSSTLR